MSAEKWPPKALPEMAELACPMKLIPFFKNVGTCLKVNEWMSHRR